MDRRNFLRNGVGVVGVAVLSGCTEQTLKESESQPELLDHLFHYEEVDLPVRQTFEIAATGVLRAEDAAIQTPGEFEEYVREQGLAVEGTSEAVRGDETVLSLEYVVGEARDRGRALEVGVVAGAFAALVEGEYGGDELDVTLLDPDGREFGEFAVRRSAAEAYNAGEMTAASYGSEAMKELQSK